MFDVRCSMFAFSLSFLRFNVGRSMLDVRCSRFLFSFFGSTLNAARALASLEKTGPALTGIARGNVRISLRRRDRHAASSKGGALSPRAQGRCTIHENSKQGLTARSLALHGPIFHMRPRRGRATLPTTDHRQRTTLHPLRFNVERSMFDVRCSMFDVRCSPFLLVFFGSTLDVRRSMFDVRLFS